MKKFVFVLSIATFAVLFFGCTKKEPTNDTEAPAGKFGTPMKFTTTDLNGNAVSSDIFKNADVTMVNIWTTWCGPCKRELPEIGNIARKYAEQGYQVIGFVHDVTPESDNIDLAREIVNEAHCEYPILMDDPSMQSIFTDISAFPTTLFIDKTGNLIGQEHIGAMDEASFDACFQKAIQQVSGK